MRHYGYHALNRSEHTRACWAFSAFYSERHSVWWVPVISQFVWRSTDGLARGHTRFALYPCRNTTCQAQYRVRR